MDETRWVTARMRTLALLSRDTVHDLRGAASGLTMHVELLARELADAPGSARERRQRAVDDVRAACRRLLATAETFVRHATFDPTPGTFDVMEAARTIACLCRPYAARRHVVLDLAGAAGGAALGHGVRDLLVQGALELAIAAVDRSARGDRITMQVATSSAGVRLVLRSAAASAVLCDERTESAATTLAAAGARLVRQPAELAIDVPPPAERAQARS